MWHCNGQTTSQLSYNATKTEIKTALEALTTIATGEVYTQGQLSTGMFIWSKTKFKTDDRFELSATSVSLDASITVYSNVLVQALAENYGLDEFHSEWPIYGAASYPMKWADDDARWLGVKWSYSTREMWVMRKLLLEAAQTIWPDIELHTDNINDSFRLF